MKAKEKAEELINKMWLHSGAQDDAWMDKDMTKQCAIIAVDEILNTNTLEQRSCGFITLSEKHIEYWQEVKQEIEKL